MVLNVQDDSGRAWRSALRSGWPLGSFGASVKRPEEGLKLPLATPTPKEAFVDAGC